MRKQSPKPCLYILTFTLIGRLDPPVNQRERFALHNGFAEVIEANVFLRHFHLETLLILHTRRMPNTLTKDIANGFLLDVDHKGTPASELTAAVGGKPTLSDLDY